MLKSRQDRARKPSPKSESDQWLTRALVIDQRPNLTSFVQMSR